jgi:hypothetical protein
MMICFVQEEGWVRSVHNGRHERGEKVASELYCCHEFLSSAFLWPLIFEFLITVIFQT